MKVVLPIVIALVILSWIALAIKAIPLNRLMQGERAQLHDAHHLLVQLKITDDFLPILPLDLREDLHRYLAKCKEAKIQ